jgi:hypothetical protein
MGKASSAKKVSRAARAGGGRRPGQRRPLGFPLLVAAVVAVGTTTVLYAREQRTANAAPRAGVDHWHAAYGFAECGEFRPALTGGGNDGLGIHSHDDGLIHIEPLLDGAAGSNAKLGLFADFVGVELTDDRVTFADGTEWDEATATCDGDPAQIVVARWIDAQAAADGERPNEVVTEGLRDVRFRNDREAYTVALVAAGQLEDIPVRPDILAGLNDASATSLPETPATEIPTTAPTTTAVSSSVTTTDASTAATAADE